MNPPPSKSVNYGNLPPNQAGQQQALGPAQGGQRPSQTGQTGTQGQVAPNQKPNPATQPTNPATKPAANNQGKSSLGDISKSRNHLIERDLNDDFVRGGGANVISDRLNFSQRRVVQGPPQVQTVYNYIDKIIPHPDAKSGRRAIAAGDEVDDSINITARNILAEAEAKVALLVMEGNRLKWLEAQRREELRRLKGGQPTPQQAPTTRVVQQTPTPQQAPTTRVVPQAPTTTYVPQPASFSTTPVVQRVSQTNPVTVQQPTRVVRAEPTTTYVQQPAMRTSQTYLSTQPTTTYVNQPVPASYMQPSTTYTQQTVRPSSPVVTTTQAYTSGQPTTVVRGPSNTITQTVPAGTYTTQRPSQTTRVVQGIPTTSYTTAGPATTSYSQGQPVNTYVR